MTEKINVLFFGTPDYSVKTLDSLFNKENINIVGVITKEDKPQGRGQKLTPSPCKDYALKHNIPCFTPHSLRKELDDFYSFVKNLGPIDISVVIAYGQILPKEVLEYPKHGSVNLHASILPHLRGAAPIQRAIMEGDTQTGVCLMKMDEGLDTGDVFIEEKVMIDDSTTFFSLYEKLSSLSATIIYDNIEKVISGEITATKQSLENVSYANKILKEEAIINWDEDAHKILRLINAMDPIFGAYTMFNEKRLKLFCPRLESFNNNDYTNLKNGEIVKSEKDYISFKCHDALLNIHEVQLEGKKRIKAFEYMQGMKGVLRKH